MFSSDLANALRAEGLTVMSLSNWDTRGNSWAEDYPSGIMEHHTAPPVPFPPDRLIADGKIKANMNTKPDGTIWLIAYGACNYSSGSGSSTVLAEAQAGIPPTANAVDRDDIVVDDVNGNPWFWNIENDHLGDGSTIPAVQLDAIVTATSVVADHFRLRPGNVISHAEWTPRKSDPYWNGDRRCIETIRERMGDEMPSMEELRAMMREELDRRYDGKAGPEHQFYGIGGGVVSTYIGKSGRTLGQMIQNTDNNVARILDEMGATRAVDEDDDGNGA